jgi:hydroxymethylbilane synthase
MVLPLRIGTRASKLARAQAEMVRAALAARLPQRPIEIVAMTTAGDRDVHKQLSDWGYKGLFTKELEDALLAQRIDLAVHSMKDMPSVLPQGLVIAAVLPRADVRDAWISQHYESPAALPSGAVVGTSSARRAAQLLHHYPTLTVLPLRGNVETRLRKIEEGAATGTFLAAAGLARLGLEEHARTLLSTETFLPAVAQGAIGIECRVDDAETYGLLQPLAHAPTMTCLAAERAFLQVLDGSCRTPIAGLATLEGDRLRMSGEVLSLDGQKRVYETIEGLAADAAALGAELGENMRANAKGILNNA